jgi:hypothetical protein
VEIVIISDECHDEWNPKHCDQLLDRDSQMRLCYSSGPSDKTRGSNCVTNVRSCVSMLLRYLLFKEANNI